MRWFLALFLSIGVSYAGPPENARKLMIPYPSVCTPGMTEMMSALTKVAQIKFGNGAAH